MGLLPVGVKAIKGLLWMGGETVVTLSIANPLDFYCSLLDPFFLFPFSFVFIAYHTVHDQLHGIPFSDDPA